MSIKRGVVALAIASLSILLAVGCGNKAKTYEVSFEDAFIVNRGPKSYIKAQVVLAANNEDAKKLLEKHKNELRDIVIGVLAKPGLGDQADEVRKLHKKAISEAINKSNTFSQTVKEVYFAEYVWQ